MSTQGDTLQGVLRYNSDGEVQNPFSGLTFEIQTGVVFILENCLALLNGISKENGTTQQDVLNQLSKLVFNFSWFISFESVLKVNFLSQVVFVFLLFWGMVMNANDVETNGKQKLPEIK